MIGSQIKKIGNMELNIEEKCAVISLSPEIFSADVVQSAINSILGKAFVEFTKETKTIMVELRPKEKDKDLEEIGREFNNQLINYAFDKNQKEKNKLFKTNKSEKNYKDNILSEIKDNLLELEQGYSNDILGISKLWEDNNIKSK